MHDENKDTKSFTELRNYLLNGYFFLAVLPRAIFTTQSKVWWSIFAKIRETFIFLCIIPYVCFAFFCWIKFISGYFRWAFFHLGEKNKWSLLALDRWSSYAVTIVWEFAWADSALIILDEWSFYRGGHLNRFDCNTLS